MKFNGNIVMGENTSIKNLTLPSGDAFPDDENLAELFWLTEPYLEYEPGFYAHDGNAWAPVKSGLGYIPENVASKDLTGGYAGLTEFKLNLMDALGAVKSYFSTTATSARDWIMPDKSGTVALISDLDGLASLITSFDTTGLFTVGITGKVIIEGMEISPAEGINLVTFNTQYNCVSSEITPRCVVDLAAAYSYLTGLVVTDSTHAATFGAGETVFAGVYSIAGAGDVGGTLYLDAQGDTEALFVFKIAGAFTSGAGATVVLINGAKSSNVFWVAGGAGSLGAATNFKGTIIIHNAALAMGDGCVLEGRLFSTEGAVAVTNATISIPPDDSVVNLKLLKPFSIFTSLGAISNTGVSYIGGDMGTNGGAVTGFSASTLTGNLYVPGMKSSRATFSLYRDGTLIPNSERVIVSSGNVESSVLHMHAVTNQALGEVIDARINVTLGVLALSNRIITAVRVTPNI